MLLTHEDLLSRLQDHLSKATGLDIAMAWASLGKASKMVLAYARQHPGSVRALIGISGSSTHPNVLREFRSFADLRLPYHHPLFHPKLIIFHFNRKSIAWLGSANLTRCGFQQNIELVAELDDGTDAKKWFNKYWEASAFDASQFQSYIDNWTPSAANAASTTPVAKGYIAPLPLDAWRNVRNWKTYVESIRFLNQYWETNYNISVDGADSSWLNTIVNGKEIVWRRSWDELSRVDYHWLLGISDSSPDKVGYGLLGSMQGAGAAKHIFLDPSPQNLRVRRIIRQSIDPVLHSTPGNFKSCATNFISKCRSIDRIGGAIATRLMSLGRPDLAVSVNRGSKPGLSHISGLPASALDKAPPTTGRAKSYADLLTFLESQTWYANPTPMNVYEEQIAGARAALLDCFVYEPTN